MSTILAFVGTARGRTFPEGNCMISAPGGCVVLIPLEDLRVFSLIIDSKTLRGLGQPLIAALFDALKDGEDCTVNVYSGVEEAIPGGNTFFELELQSLAAIIKDAHAQGLALEQVIEQLHEEDFSHEGPLLSLLNEFTE